MSTNDKNLESESPKPLTELSSQKSENLDSINHQEKEPQPHDPKKHQIIHRTIIIGKRVFEYTGPVNQEIADLLDLIEANSLSDTQGVFRIFRNAIIRLTEINEKVENRLTFLGGLIKINILDILLVFAWFVICMIGCIELKVFIFKNFF